MYPAMASPWAVVPPPPGTTMQYPYPPVPSPAFHIPPSYANVFHTPVIAPPPPPEPSPGKKKIDWPPSVRDYVQRSFDASNMDPSVSRSDMESKLKETISNATAQGTLYTVDWVNLRLPQEMIVEERRMHVLQNKSPSAFATNKKRKSQELGGGYEDDDNRTPPWQTANPRNGLEDRLTFKSPNSASKTTSKLQRNLEKRQRRQDGGYTSTYQTMPEPEQTVGPVVGTCLELEKRYFRLTAPPIPSKVRPEHILRQTLELLKKKWRKEGNYSYICDQFKSMRQDITVQRIRNDFTVTVYEIHARIALEKGDLGEYNQCQTQLRALYKQNLGGNPVEFKAYRILYFIHTSNRTALNDVMADLTITDKKQSAIKHALDVRAALNSGNYHRFFRLYLDTPNMGAYLMDMFVGRERLAAMTRICKAYKPDVKLRFITEELGFESDQDAAQFIFDNNGQALLVEKGDDLCVSTGSAGAIFEAARAESFRKIDIKGQI